MTYVEEMAVVGGLGVLVMAGAIRAFGRQQ
jgi:hypothetical protein